MYQMRRFIISGQVQGVGFRAGAARSARQHQVSGWVRNLPDGRVEAVAAGPSRNVDAFRVWLGRGPAAARVARVCEVEADGPNPGTGFLIR